MPNLTDFQHLRRSMNSAGQRRLEGSVSPDGPWFRLTKREIQALTAIIQRNAAAAALKELSTNDTAL